MTVRTAPLVPVGIALAVILGACAGGAASPSADAALTPGPSAVPSAAADLTVTAVDFGFQGLPAEVPSGTTLALTNVGHELHELVVLRKLPTTTQTFDELLAMPPQEAMALVEDVGFAYAEPGQAAAQVITVSEPGDYLAVCFIPAGTTQMPSLDPASSGPPDLGPGAPHFTLGMQQPFVVAE